MSTQPSLHRRQAGLWRDPVAVRPGQAGRAGDAVQPLADGLLFAGLELGRHPDDAGEQEEAKADRQEHVADRDDVLHEWKGDGDDVAEDESAEQELLDGPRDHDVERRRDVREAHAGGTQGLVPDRHVAAVDRDDDRVGQDADEGDAHARVAAVDPRAHEQQGEPEQEERQTQRLDDVDAGVEQGLRPEPDDDRDEQEADPAQADRRQVRDAAADPQAEEQAEKDRA